MLNGSKRRAFEAFPATGMYPSMFDFLWNDPLSDADRQLAQDIVRSGILVFPRVYDRLRELGFLNGDS